MDLRKEIKDMYFNKMRKLKYSDKDMIDYAKITLIYWSNLYYQLPSMVVVNDAEYDALFNLLKELEDKNPHLITEDSLTQRVGS